MKTISLKQILKRARQENSWWKEPHNIPLIFTKWKPRPYLDLLANLVEQTNIQRTVVLMGPRRVGKTVMIHHQINRLLNLGVPAINICYFSVDHPIYNGLSLEEFLEFYKQSTSINILKESCYVFFDEIQYLKDWEKHLKSLTDSYPNIKFLASGSAAAALKLKSTESGAGRFTDFLLPPLTFYEYLFILDSVDLVKIKEGEDSKTKFEAVDIEKLNSEFIDYLNFGGYPEVVLSDEIKSDPSRFIKSDIIDKVLLRDLPQLYGIHDIQELNSLFTTLAYNTAGEVSLSELSQNSGIAKNTIKKYIEYFEAAFLIKIIHRVDRSAKRFKRANFFKVYLTNPSMRTALFSPVKSDDSTMGSLVETAIFSQWFHHQEKKLYYARWKKGEVDIVSLDGELKTSWVVEVKWSDRYFEKTSELKSLNEFLSTQPLENVLVTTITKTGHKMINNTKCEFEPASLYCYKLGYNIVNSKKRGY